MAVPIDIFLTASAGFKTDLLDDANERKVFLEIDFEDTSTFIDISEFVDNIDISASLKSDIGGFTGATTNTAKIRLRNDQLTDTTRPFSPGFFATFNASTFHFNGVGELNPGGGGFSSSLKIGNLRPGREVKIKATVGDGNETITIFTGFVDKEGFNETIIKTENFVDFTINDGSKDLIDTKALTKSALAAYATDNDQIILINLKVCDSGDVANSLCHRIAEIGGIAAGDIISEDVLNVVPFVKLSGNVWSELSELAEAYNALIYFDGDGKLRFVRSQFNVDVIANDTFPPTVVEHTWDKTNTNKIDKRHIDVFANLVEINGIIKQATANKEIIYNFIDQATYNKQTKQNAFVIPSSAAPTQPDITNTDFDFFAEFTTEDNEKVELAIDIDTQAQAILSDEFNALSFSVYTAFANKVQIRLSNILTSNVDLFNIIIRGKPVRNIQQFNIFEVSSAANLLEHGEKLLKLQNKYFDSTTTAGTLAAFIRDFGSEVRQRFIMNVPAVLHMQTGAWIKLVLDDTTISDDVDIYCRVESYSHHFVKHGLATSDVQVVAYIFDWTDSTSVSPKIVSDATSVNFRSEELRKNPFSEDDPIPTNSELWDFAQRTTTSLGRKANLASITLFDPANEFQPVRSGYRGAIAIFDPTTNNLGSPVQLDNTSDWNIQNGATINESILSLKQFTFFQFVRPATASGTLTGIAQTLSTSIGNGSYSVQILVRRGTHTADTRLILNDTTATVKRLELNFNWTTELITETIGTGEVIKLDTDNDGINDTFLIKGTTATDVVGANTNSFSILDVNETVQVTWFATAAKMERSAFSTPFTIDRRRVRALAYFNYLNWNDVSGVQFWIRPFFNFDTATDKIFFTDQDISTEHVSFIYDASADKFKATIVDGATPTPNTLTISAGSDTGVFDTLNAFPDNDDLHQFIHIQMIWDVPNDILNLRINGVDMQILVSTLETIPFNDTISFGSEPLKDLGTDKLGNSYMFDFICIKSINTSGAINVDRHFDLDKPWINPDEITNSNATNRAATTTDINKGEINLIDNSGRQIEVGEGKGIFASDCDGNTIHDLPDSALTVDNFYMGHVYLINDQTGVAFQTSRTITGTGPTTDRDISAFLPDNIKNIKGVYCKVTLNITGNATAAAGNIEGVARYSFTFSGTPPAQNQCARHSGYGRSNTFETDEIESTISTFTIIPVTLDTNGVYHITENLTLTNTNATAGLVVSLYTILGFST